MKKTIAVVVVLILMLSMSAPVIAEVTGSYTIRTGMSGSDYVTKTVNGYKTAIGAREAIIETDIAGNTTGKAYLSGEVIGEADKETIEKVTIDGKINWDKRMNVNPLLVKFWFPNIITGSTLKDSSVGNQATSYELPGPKTLVLNETDDDTWMLIAVVKNPNSFQVKGTVNLILSSLYNSGGNQSYMVAKTCTFKAGTNYVNFGSINEWGNKFKGIGYKLNGGNEIDSATESARYNDGTSIDDITDAIYPDEIRTSKGKVQGYVSTAGGEVFKEATSVFSEGDLVDALTTGIIIPYSQFVETNYSRFYYHNKQFNLPTGTYLFSGNGAGKNFRPNGWMSCIPVVRSRPCFIDKFTFVPDPLADSSDLGYLSKTSVIGIVLDDSNITRPYINWNADLEKIEVDIQDANNTASSGTCTWTPGNGWSYTQQPITSSYLGQSYTTSVDQFTATGSWTINATYDSTLQAVNPGDTPISLIADSKFSFAQPYLTKSQAITDDVNRKCFETLINEAMTMCDSPVTVDIDPVWDTELSKIDMPASSNNPIGTMERMATFQKTYSAKNSQILGTRLTAIVSACQTIKSEEAMFVDNSPRIGLPSLDCSQYGNIFCGNTKSLVGYDESGNSTYVYEKTYGFVGVFSNWQMVGGTPNFAFSSYIKQPLVDTMDNPSVLGCASNRESWIDPSPWRVYSVKTGKVTLPD